jgi:hypothetical protein
MVRIVAESSLSGVVCAAGVMYVGVGHYPLSEIIWACALVAFLPVGVLPVAAWLGIVFPYHPRSLRWRWQHRRAWRSHLRWVVLAFAPFLYVPLIGILILSPGVQLARSIKLPDQRLTPAQFGISAAVVCATAVVAAAIGLWVARRLLHGGPPPDRLPREHRQGLTRSASWFPAGQGWDARSRLRRRLHADRLVCGQEYPLGGTTAHLGRQSPVDLADDRAPLSLRDGTACQTAACRCT